MSRSSMLVIVAVVALGIVPAPALRAQEDGEEAATASDGDGVRFLVRGGAAAATLRGELPLDGDGSSSFDVGYGAAGALAVDLPLGGRFSLQPEVVFVRRRVRLHLPEEGTRSHLNVNYVELPLMLKWYPSGKSDVRVHLDAGPALGLRLGASREVRTADTLTVVPAEDLLEEVDWALVVGAGLEFPELFVHFTVDVRYLHGLADVNVTDGSPDARWSSFQALIGVAF